MNVLLISSSPRKTASQTFKLAGEVIKGLGPSVKKEIVFLCDQKIEFCRHCEKCHEKILQCPIRDDAGEILEKMLKADGIILATPNYINQVTASMKALFDRSSHFIHCRRLLGKYVAGVVSSGSGQDGAVLDYIRHYSNTCGAQYAGGVSSATPVGDAKKKEAFDLGRALEAAINSKQLFPEQIQKIDAGKEHFKRLMKIREKTWVGEYQYWKDKGWL